MISDKDGGLDEKVYVLSVEACVEMKMYVDNDLKSVFSMCFLCVFYLGAVPLDIVPCERPFTC